ncbi:MAG TPA: methyltransferase domain-containing protein [Burkholderiales bacterium]|nr:methyltransferase domain-containing protein [Burkholderiales bacterium]
MPREDAAQPEFWEKRFRECFTPWDAGRVPAALEQFLGTAPRGRRVLIPGCGSGYEVRAFHEAGFDVLAIDFAPAAVERAQGVLGALSRLVRLADFFDFESGGPFDLIYERAFLCALPRRLWPSYAPRVAELLRPEGRLAGFFFFDDAERGPPFGLKAGEIETLLGERFDRVSDAAVGDSIPIFAGKERWQVWSRAADDAGMPQHWRTSGVEVII